MSLREVYRLSCDSCGASLYYEGRYYLPQDVLAHAALRRGWTNHGERSHCGCCPPLCHLCGTELADPGWCPACSIGVNPAGDGQG